MQAQQMGTLLRYMPMGSGNKDSGIKVEMASRGGAGGKWRRTGFQHSFRIVVGPDLVSEWMAKNGKK